MKKRPRRRAKKSAPKPHPAYTASESFALRVSCALNPSHRDDGYQEPFRQGVKDVREQLRKRVFGQIREQRIQALESWYLAEVMQILQAEQAPPSTHRELFGSISTGLHNAMERLAELEVGEDREALRMDAEDAGFRLDDEIPALLRKLRNTRLKTEYSSRSWTEFRDDAMKDLGLPRETISPDSVKRSACSRVRPRTREELVEKVRELPSIKRALAQEK